MFITFTYFFLFGFVHFCYTSTFAGIIHTPLSRRPSANDKDFNIRKFNGLLTPRSKILI